MKMKEEVLREGSFDMWHCMKCDNRFERSVKCTSLPKCPKCKSAKCKYAGQVSR